MTNERDTTTGKVRWDFVCRTAVMVFAGALLALSVGGFGFKIKSYVSPKNECAAESCLMRGGCELYIDWQCLLEKRIKNLESSPQEK